MQEKGPGVIRETKKFLKYYSALRMLFILLRLKTEFSLDRNQSMASITVKVGLRGRLTKAKHLGIPNE
ncbi:hypothetical protein AciX9_0497 [Granulicella tundricola MP5ACTX9]|uniref:Uncharacterized protein n=1 Tax=Granulicella tundricola (strain ATCC BAA-1859 / DSM 23138 / MP5ACTX9) TaxID=1198114 RepID=E8WY30_GRATM|nr:hypothetical protein AciX9_0497 [Granulicella tundricola MP5ACTX9]